MKLVVDIPWPIQSSNALQASAWARGAEHITRDRTVFMTVFRAI